MYIRKSKAVPPAGLETNILQLVLKKTEELAKKVCVGDIPCEAKQDKYKRQWKRQTNHYVG